MDGDYYVLDKYDIYHSFRLRRSLAENTSHVPFGAAHYSYGAVASKFLAMFERKRVLTSELDRPEIYVAPPKPITSNAVHIMFKPFEEFRLLKGAKNIAHVAWEFEKIPTRALWLVGDPQRSVPFADYLHMLTLPDRLWVGCRHTESVFRLHGIVNVDVIPAPIAVSEGAFETVANERKQYRRSLSHTRDSITLTALKAPWQRHGVSGEKTTSTSLSSLRTQYRRMFLSILNPGDLRKNLASLIDGFSLASAADTSICLVIKLIIDNNAISIDEFLGDILPKRYSELELTFGEITPSNIFITFDYLSNSALHDMYRAVDFYLSATFAEGQNLPLQEAMANGVVPVIANHTAMSDYVTMDNSVIVNWTGGKSFYAMSRAYGLSELMIPWITSYDVANAVRFAATLDDIGFLRKQEAAWQTIAEGYSETTILKLVEQSIRIFQ
jgi:glycosyltransferase involved in cell wall biosynthesis